MTTASAKWFRTAFVVLVIIIIAIIMILAGNRVYAQVTRSLTISEAYKLAEKNYPLVKQRDLIDKTTGYTVSNAAKGYLPVLTINGQATYQSTVTSFPFTIPIPGFTVPTYSKDQYKGYGEVDQLVYDGGQIKNQKQSALANQVIQQQNLEVQLYAVYQRVNDLFFGIILINEQLKQNNILQNDIQNGINRAKAFVANGTAYRSNVDELSAQLLQSIQVRTELSSIKRSYMDMLALFINEPLDDSVVFKKENTASPDVNDGIKRPEILAYDFQKTTFDLQEKLLTTQLLPKLGLFLQGGYGRPALNALSNEFAWFYIGGVRLSWNLGSLYTLKNQKQLLNIDRQSLDVQKETFLFNTRLVQKQQFNDIEKYTDLFKQDSTIIALRESVKRAAYAQLENGVLSAHDYLIQVNAADQARQNLILHQVQLLQAQYSYQNTIGNISNRP